MSIPANKRNITAEDLLQHPEWEPCELIEGEVVPLAPAGSPHGEIAATVIWMLGDYRRKVGRGRVASSETGILLSSDPDTVRAPDAFFTFHDRHEENFETIPPHLCVEVMSPTDTWKSITAKARQYLDFGVKLVWVVVPEDRTVHIFRPDGSRQQLGETETLTGDDVLEGFAVPVAELFV